MAPKADYDITWHGKEIGRDAAKRLSINAERAARMLETYLVKSISRSQPAMRMEDGSMRGLDPSKANEPPKMVTGRLRASIDHRVHRHGKFIDIYVSAGTDYAKKLEYGDEKTRLASRPFMRPTLAKNKDKAIKMLVKGLFKEKKSWDKRRLR